MKSRVGVNVFAAAVAVFALSLAADVSAGRTGVKAKARAPRQAETFSLSTEFTGYVGQTMEINHVRYTVAPNATIYMIGEGVVPVGTSIYSRSIYLAGERHGKELIVRCVIVRPFAADSRSGGDGIASVGVVSDPMPPR